MQKINFSPARGAAVVLAGILLLFVSGCARVAGNFPPVRARTDCVKARFIGEGFQILAGPGLPLDGARAELGQLKSQGFSRRDPQIIRSVARRKRVPAALLSDRSGHGYYRFTARLEPGTSLRLAPGALRVTVETRRGTAVVNDLGYLLEDRRHPAGCRPPARSTLALESTDDGGVTRNDFLVRLPVCGEIVGIQVVPRLLNVVRK